MPYGVDPADAVMMARTMWGENTNASPDEYAAIANVMRNRLASGEYGSTMPSVLRAPNQFQAWNDPSAPNYPMKAPLNSPAFRSAYQTASNVLSGLDDDPTGGAVYYYNPKGVNKTPSFAAGREGTPIGQHVFYGPQTELPAEDQATIEKYYPKQKSKSAVPGGLTDEDQSVINKYYPSKTTDETVQTPSTRVAGDFQLMQQAEEDKRLAAIDKPLREVGPSSETLATLVGAPLGGAAAFGAAKALPMIITKGIPSALKWGGISAGAGLASALAQEALGPEKGARLMELVRHAIHYGGE